MTKAIFAFIVLTLLVMGVTITYRELGSKERWQVGKVIFFASSCSFVAIALLVLFVILF